MKRSIKRSIYDFSVENNLPHILSEYKDEKDIHSVGFDSTTPVKWICENGHEIVESPHVRLRRKGAFCPYCGKNRKGTISQNDIEIAKMYSADNLVPADRIPCDSSLNVKWVCEKGHTWERTVANQMRIKTCPVCAQRIPSENYSLFALHPELENEWDEKKNEGVDKEKLMPNTNRKLWWTCKQGHSYECTAADRHRGKGCPICAGKKVVEEESIAVTDKHIVEKYWDYEKNSYKPTELPRTSKRRVWINVNGIQLLISIEDFVKSYQ